MPPNVYLLEEGFDLIAEQGGEVVDLFYARLIRMDPKFRRRFRLHTTRPVNMAEQQKKLVSVLLLVRKSLRNLNALGPALHELGERHTELRVQPHEYMAVVYALVESMAEVGGHGWMERYGGPWAEAALLLSEAMWGSSAAEAKLQSESDRWMIEKTLGMREHVRDDLMHVYGGHTDSCRTRKWWAHLFGPAECTCGWPQARATFFGPA